MDPLEGADRVPQSAFTAGREGGRQAGRQCETIHNHSLLSIYTPTIGTIEQCNCGSTTSSQNIVRIDWGYVHSEHFILLSNIITIYGDALASSTTDESVGEYYENLIQQRFIVIVSCRERKRAVRVRLWQLVVYRCGFVLVYIYLAIQSKRPSVVARARVYSSRTNCEHPVVFLAEVLKIIIK